MIVRVHEDITTHENKVLGNFTARQLLCGVIAILLIYATFSGLLSLLNSVDIAGLLACTLGIPIFLCAIVKRDGLYFEKIILEKLKEKIYHKQRRPFVMQNLYEDIQQFAKEENEIENKTNQPSKSKKIKAFRDNPTLAKAKHRSGKRPL